MPDRLEPIMKYHMSVIEAKAFKLALQWEDHVQEIFPEYSHSGLRKTGDPRKSILFRYCLKLAKETKGLIADQDYGRYIKAQLYCYKNLPEQVARIDPIILTGPKAWKRWLWYKYITDKERLIQDTPDATVKACPLNIKNELKKTREYLFAYFKGVPAVEEMQVTKEKLLVWIATGRISPYYVILSPFIAKLSIEKYPIELAIHKKSITPEIETFFKIEFHYEFIY
jgi:hypothetical protein